MIRLSFFLREHRFAFALAFLVSIIVAFPQIYFRVEHRNDGIYQGIELMPDSFWSPRIREVQDGHLNFGSIYWKEGKDGPYIIPPLGSIVVGYTGKIFSLGINNTLLLSRLIFPFIAFFLIYSFAYLLFREKNTALSSAAVIILADAALNLNGITQLLRGASPVDFLVFAKPVNPAMIFIFFFGFLVLFWLFYRTRRWYYGVASAILLGLNFYNYFYSWTYLYAFGGILGLTLLLRRRWNDAARVAAVYLGALVVAIPYLVNLYRATVHPLYGEVSMRIGIIESYAPIFVGWIVIGALAVYLGGFPKDDRQKYWFGLALLLAPFMTLNQQLLTGKIAQAGHYHWYFHKPMAVIFVLAVIFYILQRRGYVFWRKTLTASIIAASVGIGIFIQGASYSSSGVYGETASIERQRYGPVMEWLSQNARKESVVMANDDISHLVTVYTPLNVFFHRSASYSSLTATESRLFEMIFAFYRLRGIDERNAREVFFAERNYISSNIYHLYYRELLGSTEAIPDNELERILSFYEETLSIATPEWLRRTWTKYEVEYVVWDRKQDSFWQLSQYPFLEEVAVFGDLAIYRFSSDEKEKNQS